MGREEWPWAVVASWVMTEVVLVAGEGPADGSLQVGGQPAADAGPHAPRVVQQQQLYTGHGGRGQVPGRGPEGVEHG